MIIELQNASVVQLAHTDVIPPSTAIGEQKAWGIMDYTQDNRLIAIHTPLGKDKLLLQKVVGQEAISQCFQFDLELLSRDASIAFDKIVGQRVAIRITLADESKRYINGFVSHFAQCGSDVRFTYYRAKVVPWLWFLTHTEDCRIFQHMTVPDIIAQIFTDLELRDFRNLLQGQYEPMEYCVQYHETDFDFVSRLMEQNGIFYFFQHDEDRHILILADSPATHQVCPGQPRVRYHDIGGAQEEEDTITEWQMTQALQPGRYALTDYNFETPRMNLSVNVASKVPVDGNSRYEVYEYPGKYYKRSQGESLVKIRMEEKETQHLVVQGQSSCRAFATGYRFDLTEHYRRDMNQTYVLMHIKHEATVGNSYTTGDAPGVGQIYTNSFSCIPYTVPFRPRRSRRKPIIQGPQTAMVVGKSGEEIWVDQYGRVKVQFHWDREGKRDEKSSCWIRVAQSVAGNRWGSIFIPRIGQEVIIDFLEGDPDQPIITGCVYNGENMPPYDLPGKATQSGFQSRSAKEGDQETFNEIRFEDKKGNEELYIHAERNLTTIVENSESHSVGGDRSTTIDKDENINVKQHRTVHIDNGHETIVIHTGNHTLSVNTGHATLNVRTGNRDVNAPAGAYQLRARDIRLTASSTIELVCGGCSIRMDVSGNVTINGVNLKAIASAINDIKGSLVKINT